MKLKYKLFMQNMLILIGTVVVTLCLSGIFFYLYTGFGNIPLSGERAGTKVILTKNNDIVYSEFEISKMQIKEILMNNSVGINNYKYKNNNFNVAVENYIYLDETYLLIKLSPAFDFQNFYNILSLFAIIVFFISFILASIVVQKSNIQNIINPIVKLKKDTEKISEGNLSTEIVSEGYGEVYELCQTVEILRIRLKDSLYYQEKYDENRKFLMSSISHDLRTPVTAVRGYMEGVLDGVANTKEKQEDYILKAISKIDLINTMIDDLLLYSKLDLDQLSFEINRFNIINYIRDSISDNHMAFENEHKSIILETDIKEAFVNIDGMRFKRVIQNILDNARKHTKETEGQVIIKIRETAASVIIEFSDNGTGIKSEELPHIFDRFYRGDTSRKSEGSSGLGLAIAKLIVENMGGRIWAAGHDDSGVSILISLKKQEKSIKK